VSSLGRRRIPYRRLNVSAVISTSTLLPPRMEYPRRLTGSSPCGDSETSSRPITLSPKLANVSTDTLPQRGTLVSARPGLWLISCLRFITVLEFSTNDLNNFFYYVPRPHLPPGMHSVMSVNHQNSPDSNCRPSTVQPGHPLCRGRTVRFGSTRRRPRDIISSTVLDLVLVRGLVVHLQLPRRGETRFHLLGVFEDRVLSRVLHPNTDQKRRYSR
jgi:hypothetical protein